MIFEELKRISSWEERHRRLLARLAIVVLATIVVDALGSVLIYFLERGAHGTEIHGFGDQALAENAAVSAHGFGVVPRVVGGED